MPNREPMLPTRRRRRSRRLLIRKFLRRNRQRQKLLTNKFSSEMPLNHSSVSFLGNLLHTIYDIYDISFLLFSSSSHCRYSYRQKCSPSCWDTRGSNHFCH